jgi:hypothetical protein
MDILSVSTAGTKRVTAKITQPVQLLQFVAVITGNFAAVDRVAQFHTSLGTQILTVNKRNADGSISDIINARPLDEVLNVDAIATGRYIRLVGTATELTIYGTFDLGNNGSLFANQSQYVEVTLDLGATAAAVTTITGWSNDYANPGHKKLEVVACLASQSTQFPVEPNHVRVAVPSTVTRLLLKSSQQCDQDMDKNDLAAYLRDTNGLCFVDNGAIVETSKWFVFPYSTFSTMAGVTLSAAGLVYVVKTIS